MILDRYFKKTILPDPLYNSPHSNCFMNREQDREAEAAGYSGL